MMCSNAKSNIKKENSIIAINISVGSSIRYWKTESWIELINNIFNAYKNIYIVLLSTEVDKDILNKILTGLNETRTVNAGNYSIQHFASYIRMADLMISTDTVFEEFNPPKTVLRSVPRCSATRRFIKLIPNNKINIKLK